MALTETAQSCSPKLLTLSARQSSGQRSGIVITSSSAGVSAASNRSGIANRLIAMRAEPTHADPAAGPHAFDAPLFAEVAGLI